ncbi:MAG: class II aldolase/adducin family protein [Gemmatimonadales bacterium]|nr:MAG: class II aldolase/adducin family protein [Gemmatimonadales bacterium]
MDFSFAGHLEDARFAWFVEGLREVMENRGHTWVADPQDASLVVNCFDPERPRPFRRRAQAVFVVSLTTIEGGEQTVHEAMPRAYPLLVRSLANLLIGLTGGESEETDAHFVTPEQGHYRVDGTADRSEFFRRVYERIEPLATSRLVIDNVFQTDLPEELRDGNEITRSIREAGKRLDALDLLPAPFPIDEILSERDRRHLKRLYGLGGLSYGNISARQDEDTFWMSASGVDKSDLQHIGRDILLVREYDKETGAMVISVPPDVEPRRVSVDAIEHWMIYQEHPDVGAILHVHAWIEGVPSTEFNYPCGTYELGQAVADIVRTREDPSRAVVGLKNHGLTITGRSLEDIFERVEDRLLQYVPMS